MGIELRQSTNPKAFKLYEGNDWIGDIKYHAPEEPGDVEFWTVSMWSMQGTGKEWDAEPESFEEAVHFAHLLYEEEFIPERRSVLKPAGEPLPISTPMGGQPRR